MFFLHYLSDDLCALFEHWSQNVCRITCQELYLLHAFFVGCVFLGKFPSMSSKVHGKLHRLASFSLFQMPLQMSYQQFFGCRHYWSLYFPLWRCCARRVCCSK